MPSQQLLLFGLAIAAPAIASPDWTLQSISAQNPSPAAALIGDWEGALEVDGQVVQAIVWRFKLSPSDVLLGFMGPAQAGPVLPMQDITVTATKLSFSLSGQGGFAGTISSEGIRGTWTDREADDSDEVPDTADVVMLKQSPKPATAREFNSSDRMWLGTRQDRSSCIATGDLDGDGDVDLVVGSGRHWPQMNQVFFNNGSGRFQKGGTIGSERDSIGAAAAGDLNGDGFLDVVAANSDSHDQCFINVEPRQ